MICITSSNKRKTWTYDINKYKEELFEEREEEIRRINKISMTNKDIEEDIKRRYQRWY